jgi:hypothetical protein
MSNSPKPMAICLHYFSLFCFDCFVLGGCGRGSDFALVAAAADFPEALSKTDCTACCWKLLGVDLCACGAALDHTTWLEIVGT